MARFDTFVFDLDGTLLDTLPDLVVLTNAALNEQGFPSRTADEIHSFVGNGARALMYQAVPADASPEQAEAAMRRWMELYPVIGNKLTKPYPHMEETLAALAQRGIGLGVLSNKFDQGVHDVIDAYLPGLFPVQYGECDEIRASPTHGAAALHRRAGVRTSPHGVRGRFAGGRPGVAQRRRVRHRRVVGLSPRRRLA